MDDIFSDEIYSHISLGCKEYETVEKLVQKTYPRSCILFMYKIDNEELDHNFIECFQEISNKRGKEPKIHQMFHGTQKNSITSISQTGFDPKYNKRSAYGKGSYFSMFGSYSINYTNIDKNDISYMFICDVIVGECCRGSGNQVLDLSTYDNFTDNLQKPTMYITPYRYGAIPRYIVAFYKNAKF